MNKNVNPYSEISRIEIAKALSKMETNIPGDVISYKDGRVKVKLDLAIEGIELTPLVNVPVSMIGGKYCMITEVNPGDEGTVFFTSRCISEWIKTGKYSNSLNAPRFSIDDAWFLPGGIRSAANALVYGENNGIRLTNEDGSQYAWLKKDGTFHCSGKVFSDGVELTTINHIHEYIDSQGQAATPVPSKTKKAEQQ